MRASRKCHADSAPGVRADRDADGAPPLPPPVRVPPASVLRVPSAHAPGRPTPGARRSRRTSRRKRKSSAGRPPVSLS
ncbi:MAG: hypothetical protein EA350_17245 [Gemmatimonadales bacterium]|nr:MAG: hypothetical protein EA350_17245 [Gemmatimonadales bacterium]